jgi:tetratricopeptide (TPR) repeat protein
MPLPGDFGPSGTIATSRPSPGASGSRASAGPGFESLALPDLGGGLGLEGALPDLSGGLGHHGGGDLSLDDLDLQPPGQFTDGADLPAAREDMPLPGDLLMSRHETPSASDLPVAREDMPMPGDFPAPREAIPRPGDLPAPRQARSDLPQSRDSIPRPGDYPAPRESVPRPDDYLASRESVPRPDDYLASRESVPRPDDLLAPLGSEQLPGNLPVSRGRQPAARPQAPPARAPAAGKKAPTTPRAAPAIFDPFADEVPIAPSSPLEPLELGDDLAPPQEGHAPEAPPPPPAADFGLELEGGSPSPSDAGAGPRPLPFQITAAAKAAGAAAASREDGFDALSPITRRQQVSEVEEVRPPRRRLFMIVGVAGGLLLIATAGFLVLESRRSEPRPEDVLGGLVADVARDHYPAYQKSADRLLEATGNHPEAVGVRAAAAENLLVAFLARGGERAKLSQAEQLVTALPSDGKPNPYAARARALLAVARGKSSELSGLLGAEAGTPEGELVLALRDVVAGKREQASSALRRVIAARPDRMVAHYLLGRTLEESNPAEAKKEYQAVLARSPEHFGAALGMARLLAKPAERLAAAEGLLARKGSGVSRAEIAEAHVAVGRGAAALGRSAEASAAYGKAVAADPQNASANVAMGEALLGEGRWAEALARFQAAGPAALRTPLGKFGFGGALIATGQRDAGLAQIRQAAQESPTDPRGLYYTGLASELATRPHLEAAAQEYRASLALDRTFLPASLRLAALMQREGKPQEALAVLQRAEEAGAPAAALQIAWGQALIQANQPVRAEEVFRKAVAATPKEVAPYVGLANALEAQGKRPAAGEVLEKALAKMPGAVGLREPLAAIDVALGRKDEAMMLYQAEIATGRAAGGTRVALARLALDLGRLDEAQAELDKVIEENPATPGALFTSARVWEARRDSARALQEYRRALRFENPPELSLAFARALLKVGRESEAMTALDGATALPDGLIERGRALYRKGDYERALSDFQGATKLAPRDARAWTWRGMSHAKLGEAEKAADAWTTALKLAPDDAETHYRLGHFQLDKGRVKDALDHLRKAASRMPEKPEWEAELYFQLGTAEATGGSRPAAAAAFQRYLDLAPQDAPARPEVEKQIHRLRGR